MARFRDLERGYQRLLAIDFDFNQLPATDELRKYKEWKQDPEKRKRPGVPNSGRKATWGLLSFGHPSDNDDNKQAVKIGSRTRDQINGLAAGLKDSLGLDTNPDATYNRTAGFKPAKVVAALRTGGSADVSEITGNSYRRMTGSSFTMPFGRVTATQTEFEAQAGILTAFDELYVVTFVPEKIARN